MGRVGDGGAGSAVGVAAGPFAILLLEFLRGADANDDDGGGAGCAMVG